MIAGRVSGEEQVRTGGPAERRLGKSCIADAGNRRGVQIVVHDSVHAVIANVGYIENELSRE